MKLEFEADRLFARRTHETAPLGVAGETDPLQRVLLCAPNHLEPVPCCSVTKESIRAGFESDTHAALAQHRGLREILADSGAKIDLLPPRPGMPDLCFTRDVGVSTPWGLVALNPALKHRAVEVAHFKAWAEAYSQSRVEQITVGSIEGGDVCVARPGLLILGVSGNRTDDEGAEAFAARFRHEGWEVLLYRFDEHFLHLDTIFSMLNPTTALGCTEVLDDEFLENVASHGIQVLPVTYKESRRLGCNVVSIDGQRIVAGAGTPRVSAMMRDAGFTVTEANLDQFTACGGGVHCLTMPLLRAS
jgi:arginine deiminase